MKRWPLGTSPSNPTRPTPSNGPATLPMAARTAELCHAALGSSRPATFMSCVATVDPTPTSHTSDIAGTAMRKRTGADHVMEISV